MQVQNVEAVREQRQQRQLRVDAIQRDEIGVGEAGRVGEAEAARLDDRRERQAQGDRPADGELPPGRPLHRGDDLRRVAVGIEAGDQHRGGKHRQREDDDHGEEDKPAPVPPPAAYRSRLVCVFAHDPADIVIRPNKRGPRL